MVALYSYVEGPNKEVAKFNVAMLVGVVCKEIRVF